MWIKHVSFLTIAKKRNVEHMWKYIGFFNFFESIEG